ncbi:MAG: PaaI family thioesterase [Pseudomonadota bacterium]
MSQAFADAMPFAKSLGLKITKAEKDEIVGELIVREDLCTTGSVMHGGAIMAVADSVGAIGGYLNLSEGANGTTTVESKTNFLAAAPAGSEIKAIATPISTGRRLSVWQIVLTRADGKKVALVTQTQLVL